MIHWMIQQQIILVHHLEYLILILFINIITNYNYYKYKEKAAPLINKSDLNKKSKYIKDW